MTDTEQRRFTTDANSSHYDSRIVFLSLDGDKFALPAHEATEFFKHLSTTLGCLEGFDADVYTEINEMVREERSVETDDERGDQT